MLELKIAKFGDNRHAGEDMCTWPFIIAYENGKAVLYAEGPLEGGGHLKHILIAGLNKVPKEEVFGGARVRYTVEKVTVEGESIEYGPVPSKLMEEFLDLIVEKVREFYPVRAAKVAMSRGGLDRERKKMWESLGYSFD